MSQVLGFADNRMFYGWKLYLVYIQSSYIRFGYFKTNKHWHSAVIGENNLRLYRRALYTLLTTVILRVTFNHLYTRIQRLSLEILGKVILRGCDIELDPSYM